MDILKVLSRGIKPTQKSKSHQATALPSAGAAPHPQLFHDPVASTSRGKKRKRNKKQDDATDDHNDGDGHASDIDYFAPKKPAAEPTPAETEDTPKKRKIKLLDEEECRQILRSHRLKFTVLSEMPPVNDSKDEPSKSKKQKKEDKKNKKDGKKDKKASKDSDGKQEGKKDEKKQIYPQPLNAFGELHHSYEVSAKLASNIYAQGFRVPTEVQLGSLPLLLRPAMALKKSSVTIPGSERGADFLAVAPTGSGKTITFLIPAIDGVLRRREELGRSADEHVLEAVIVAPTRELATQIVNEGRKLAIGTGVRVVLMKRTLRLPAEEVEVEGENEDASSEASSDDGEGSGSDSDSGKENNDGVKPPARVDILVTTPRTLLNFLTGKRGVRRTLPAVRLLVLDEADVLLDPVFREQTMGIWRACTHPDVGLTCWSATMASSIEDLITKQLAKRVGHGSSPRPLIRLVVGLKDTAVPNITHKLIYTATEQGKLLALRQLLHPASSADSGPPLRPPFLVFTQTIERAQALHDELKYDIPIEAGGSARVAALHSNMSESARSRVMARFRAGEVWVLITTDVLARGVDFAGVNGVVNYDVPTSAAGYVHRAGRTGRAGREGGVAVTFYTKEDIPFVKSVANVIAASERQAGRTGEAAAVQKWLLDALPDVPKEERRKLKVRGVESRRSQAGAVAISTKSKWERQKEKRRQQAIEASKKRKKQQRKRQEGEENEGGDDSGSEGGHQEEDEWSGLDD